MRIGSRIYRNGEVRLLRNLLGDENTEKRGEIIDFAALRFLFCETVGDCDGCDGDCKKSPTISGCLASALANA